MCTREYEEAAQDEDAAGRTGAQGVTPRCRGARGYRSTHKGAGHHTRVQDGEGEVAQKM